MNHARPGVAGIPHVKALLRVSPEDFLVCEQLGFEPSGEGEHAFLQLEKRELNTADLMVQISRLSGIARRDIGVCGMKDRHAISRQWFSVRLAGKAEPDWAELECTGQVKVLQVQRHLRKLKRGVHKANRFELRLRDLHGNQQDLLSRLERVRSEGVPNYFGEQRFGRQGSTLKQARQWMHDGGRKISRHKRSLFLSALRADMFNALLAERVEAGNWNRVLCGDVCMLQGSRSLFACDTVDEVIRDRAACGDIHPGLPLWGRGRQLASSYRVQAQAAVLSDTGAACGSFLEGMGLDLAYRPSRVLPDDFCWQFCDDGSLHLSFALTTGSYATAVLVELVQYNDVKRQRVVVGGDGSE